MESLFKRSRSRELIAYIIAFLLCSLIMVALFHLRHADLSVPFIYDGGDAVFYSMVIKAIITNGWYLNNNYLGMPFGSNLHDFPMPDNLHFLVIKLMGFFISDFARILNLFYLLTFPLTTLCSLYVLRRFGISYMPAVLASLLFAFTNYHVRRSEHHLMYSAYYAVPLVVMILLWMCSREVEIRSFKDLRDRKLIRTLLLCVFVALAGGVYYTYFALLLICSVGIFLTIQQKSLRGLILPAVVFVVILGTFTANVIPNIIYRVQHGKVDAAQRLPGEAEIYGLKITQLLLPVDEHRLKPLSDFRSQYNNSPLNNENRASSLGIIGAIGFLILLGRLLYKRNSSNENQNASLLDNLSVLNASSVLLGTIGGFGSLLAHLVSPQIRAYNRFSVYIGFFSLFTVALVLDRLGRKFFVTNFRRVLYSILILLLTFLGVLDQTAKRLLPDFNETKAEYQQDRKFIGQIEAMVPPNTMIFQLPVQTFPEGESYRHLLGYLHAKNLRWSFGAMRQRRSDQWQKTVASMPPSEMIETLIAAGFGGIYIDHLGYADKGVKVESELSNLLLSHPVVNDKKNLAFFNLTEYLQSENPAVDWNERRENALNPLQIFWQANFYAMEGTPEDNWHWCTQNGRIELENPLSRPRKVKLDMSVSTIEEGTLRIESQFFNEQLRVNTTPTPISRVFTIPPGKHPIRFVCDAPVVHPSGDTRALVFRVNNLKLDEKK